MNSAHGERHAGHHERCGETQSLDRRAALLGSPAAALAVAGRAPLPARRAGARGGAGQRPLARADARRGRCWCGPTTRIEADAAAAARARARRRAGEALAELAGETAGIAADDLDALQADIARPRACPPGAWRARSERRLRPGVRRARRPGAVAGAGRDAAAVVVRHQRRRGGAREAGAAPSPDRRRAQFAHPPDRGGAVPDVVPRPRSQARPGQQRLCPGGRGARRRRGHRARRRADRRARARTARSRRARKAQETGRDRLAHAAGDHPRRAAHAAHRQRAAVDRRRRRLRDRRPGPGGRAVRACPLHRIAARAGRPDDRRHRAVRPRPQR